MKEEELAQVDAQLKGLFVEDNIDEMKEVLKEQSGADIFEICEYSWGVIKKYYENKRFDLLFQHIRFVAYTCFIVEYAFQSGLINEEEFGTRAAVFQDIYDLKTKQN